MTTVATRKALVLAYLRGQPGVWINGRDLTSEEVGGSEGLRRLRELIAEGHEIGRRAVPGGYQYRLVPPAPAGQPSGWRCAVCGYEADPGRERTPTLDPKVAIISCPMCRKRTVHRARR